MTYSFGYRGGHETLNIKDDKASNLTDFCALIRETDVDTTIDRFRVIRKISEKADSAGNVYEWYEIDSHSRDTDKTPPLRAAQQDTDEQTVELAYRLSLLELGVN